jgi:hypothetical protein
MRYEQIERLAESRFQHLPLYGLQTIQQLADVLEEPLQRIRHYAHQSHHYYSEYNQPKSHGGVRHIEEPSDRLKSIQKKLLRIMQREPMPVYLSSPAKHRSVISNAIAHRDRVAVACLDIENFFSRCMASKVFWLFHGKMRCSREVSAILTQLLCFNGHLPTGAPTSPILAFFINEEMFNHLYLLLGSQFCRMSLWVDDLMISEKGSSNLRLLDKGLLHDIEELVSGWGFRIKRSKIRLYQPDQPALMAGIIVMPNGERRLPNRLHLKWYETKERIKASSGDEKERLKLTATSLKSQRYSIEKSNQRYRPRQ